MAVDDELQVFLVVDARYFACKVNILEHIPDPVVEIVPVWSDVVVEHMILELIEDACEFGDVLHRLAVGQDEVFLPWHFARQVVDAYA